MKPRMFVICDDVRQEVGAKFSLMGLLDDSIDLTVSGDEPMGMRMALYLELDLEAEDPLPTMFRFELEQADSFSIKAGGDVHLPETRPRMLRFVSGNMQTPPLQNGVLDVTFGLSTGENEVFVAKRSIKVNLLGPKH
jgi:hypothetical protein